MKYSESLKKNKDFQYIYRKGKSYANKYLVMYVLENGTSQNRLGISVSKKVDIIVIARIGAKGKDYKDIVGAMLHLAHLHKIIDEG